MDGFGCGGVALRSRPLAAAAFLLAATALLLPWWALELDDGQVRQRDAVRPFRPEPPLTTEWGPWLSGLLAAAAVLVLFVRLAAASHLHEPDRWRRDLAVAAAFLGAAAAAALLWPAGVPWFWGGRTHHDPDTGLSVTESAAPLLGWWLALVAAVLALLAWTAARREGREEPGPAEAGVGAGAKAEGSTPAGGTDK